MTSDQPVANSLFFRLVAAGSVLLGLYSLRFLLVGWTEGIAGYVVLMSSPVVAADLAATPWPQQALRFLVVIGDIALPILILRHPRIALYLAPVLLVAAQAGWVQATFDGGNYAVHTAVGGEKGMDWADLLDWLKLALRLFVVAGVFYLTITPHPENE